MQGSKLDVETAFTTIAILAMVTHPANMVMTIVPRAVAAFAGFDRIQSFLCQKSLADYRGRLSSSQPLHLETSGQSEIPANAILMQNLKIGERHPILDNVNLAISSGSITIVTGSVGSGKSTLLRALLGEITPMYGSIDLSTRNIAYCSQKPWIPRGTIKEVIHGMTNQVDDIWYDKVKEICCLAHDLRSLPDGDETKIGSQGLNLSGGQRQRVVSDVPSSYSRP